MKFTQSDFTNLVKILENQTVAINNLSKRLLDAEILIASITDLIIDKNLITNEDLLEILNKKIDMVNDKIDLLKEQKESETQLESFPYFGKPGEA